MGWIRVSDDFYDNDKFSEVGPLGVALHFAAMGFCNRNLTDGFFKRTRLDFSLTSTASVSPLVNRIASVLASTVMTR